MSSSSGSPTLNSLSKMKMMIKRRRTKSDRNSRAGKPPKQTLIVQEGIALDAEIDKILEEKAIKSNLTATNVKSIIKHVITDNMVRKMIMSTVKKKGNNPDNSSDDEACYEPKLTRARTKLLLGSKNISPQLWTLASPAKPQPPVVSETHVLFQEELPESSSGDEDFVPKEQDETHSEEDECSSFASHTSDAGSPQVLTSGANPLKRKIGGGEFISPKSKSDSCFKTPPPVKPKCARKLEDSTIGQRTRSKLPLNDTPLEDLEMQLIPPDITTEMYDWGIEDNEEYLEFLNDFQRSTPVVANETGDLHDDEEADPEYNIMDEEEEHDKEELRRDRAVTVSKKELNELVANLLEESHFTSGEEFDERDFTSFCASQLSHMSMANIQEKERSSDVKINDVNCIKGIADDQQEPLHYTNLNSPQQHPPPPPIIQEPTISAIHSEEEEVEKPWFDNTTLAILKYQLAQHVQLLAQTYALTATREEPVLKTIALNAKRMIIEVRNIKQLNGEASVVSSVPNSEPAWQLVNNWPLRPCVRSPIKKKILVEQYLNERQTEWTEACGKKLFPHFPRDVAKAIAESEAFMFPNLLPKYYEQICERKLAFALSEDILLVYGMDQLKEHSNMSWKEKAKLIADQILTARTSDSVYHRIRNLRKKKNLHGFGKVVKEYLEFGVINVPKNEDYHEFYQDVVAVAPCRQARENVPRIWWNFISNLLIQTEEIGKSSKSYNPPKRKPRARAEKPVSIAKPTSLQQVSSAEYITSTFPSGLSAVQQQMADNPDQTAIPIMNLHNHPEVYMFVPKYALPATGYNVSPKGTESNTLRKFYHPIPTYKPSTPTNPLQESAMTFTPVGEPFSLPDLSNFNQDVIDLSTLNTPMKKVVMEKIESADKTSSSNINSDLTDNEVVDTKERIQHSARTFGNFLRSQVKSQENEMDKSDTSTSSSESGECSSNSSSSYSSSSSSSSDEETSGKPEQPIPVVTLNSDQEEVENSSSVKLLRASDFSRKNKNQPTENDDKPNNNDQHQHKMPNEQQSSSSSSTNQVNSSKIQQNNSLAQQKGTDDGDDEDDDNKPRKLSETPEDAAEDEIDKEEDTEEDTEDVNHTPDTVSNSKTYQHQTQSKNKACKRGSSSPPKKRAKGVAVEVMLESDVERDHDVSEAFMETFIGKVKTVTESKHPNLFNEFVKILAEAGETSMMHEEVGVKIKSLLKEYPQLFREFSTFFKENNDQASMEEESDFSDYEEMQAQFNFLRHLEKFTEKNPQLKAKILHKFKVLKEETNLSERDIAEALSHFFQGNAVMMSAFQALYPSVYLLGTVNEASDFEELHIDNETITNEAPEVELVLLPEEKKLPASSTCPCSCHATTMHAYLSRMKHCSKCCIKFQDGKVFVHSSRLIKPVNVELTSPSAAKKVATASHSKSTLILSTQTHGPSPNKIENLDLQEEPEPKKPRLSSTDLELPVLDKPVRRVKPTKIDDLEDGELADEEGTEKSENLFTRQKSVTNTQPRGKQQHSNKAPSDHSTKVNLKPWSIEEDHLLLNTYRSESSIEQTFSKLEKQLYKRDRTEIESRYVELMSLLQQNMANAGEDNEKTTT